ncbi:MAG: enoyl-CoA hydratase/isomerase family protein [Proteobacteria bacterium]|nr:enoyl-CoA hydratase/isomerase family protein [Pseudomonadota bacterium]MCG2739093.1 3-hydroxyacyl-CoA dehydrogenase NAD-binding domain-containing protein [Syntrophaceae bacterium]
MGKVFNMVVDGAGVGVVTFDVAGEKMNTWTEEAFNGFDHVMRELETSKGISGVIFISGKPENFLAGANLKMISQIDSAEEVRQFLDRFHGSFARLEALGFPAVAAIHGHCLGGGLEFALACTARIAKEGKSTLIGLPECNVGLFPGAGGTQRLPRLIGYPALELILKGTMLPAAKAYEMGIIDRLIPADGDLLASAKNLLEEVIAGTANLKRPVQDFTQVDAVAEMAKAGILKATKGREIPGPMLALKSMHEGLKVSLAEGIEIEKKNFVEVVLTKEAKGSINTFFIKGMTDKPQTMMTKGFVPKPLKKIAVLGFGTMGRGIVIDILRNTQLPVLVKDIPEALEPGKAFVRKILDGMAEKKRLKEPVDAIMSRLTVTTDYIDAFREADIVIEAVFEEIGVKKQVYGELGKVVREDCIIASNTSSIPITSMAPFVAKPERFGGIHFFSPVWLMQLVEVIRGEQTAQETIDNLLNFAGLIRKRPIVCRDNAGFVVNAMLFPNFVNALKYIEEGNSIEKVDRAMTRFGMPVGPIRLIDEVGIDVLYKIFVGMGIKQETVKSVVEAGRLGLKKSGKGFFLKDGSVDPEVLPLIVERPPHEVSEEEIQMGIFTAMVQMGKDILDRKIVDDVRMIDVGIIWGLGFPADKGGPMKWADLIGLSRKLYGKNFY